MNRLTDALKRGPILLDGAVGTELVARGADLDGCLEELNLSDPSLIRSMHRDYIAAGADMIETNTFGATAYRLREYDLGRRLADINTAGARLAVEARNASGRPVLVAASISQLGPRIEPIGEIKTAAAEQAYRDQIEALVAGGVDVLLFETYTSLPELVLAVRTANRVAPDLPVIAMMSFDDPTPEVAQSLLRAMSGLRVAALGANCGNGPAQIGEAVRQLRAAGAGTLGGMPNAGLPQRVGGRFAYASGPEYFAAAGRTLIRDGATIVGGCCGTTPAHIAALRRGMSRAAAPSISSERPEAPAAAGDERAKAPLVSKLAAQLRRGDFVFSVELTPPRGVNPRKMLEGAHLLKEAGVDFANITDSAMARLRMGVMSCAALVQQQVGLESIAHFTTRDRNVMAIQSELIGAHALGIRNVLCMRGDPPRIGDYPNATAVWDVNAVGLITILSNLNRGQDANGTMIGDGADFFIGAAFNPTAGDLAREIRLLERKIRAGAQFLVTNPVYDPRAFDRVRDRLAELEIPVLVGLMPLASARHASYLQHEVPGIVVPDEVRERIERAGPDAPKVGVEMALELLSAMRGITHGAYVIPAIGRYDLAAQVVLGARETVG